MGSSSQNTKTNSTENFNQSATPTNPAFVTNGLTSLGNTVNNLNNLDPYSLVSGPNTQQTQAASTLMGPSGVGNTSNADLGGAADVMRSLSTQRTAPSITASAQAPAVSQLISHFENPNLAQVVNPSLAAFDYNAGQTQAQQALTQAGTDAAFGGSGGALAQAATNSQLALQRGQLASGLYSNAYDSALQGAENEGNLIMQARQQNLQAQQAQAQAQQQQQQLQQSAATSLGNLGLAYDQNARANSSALQGIGDDLRGITQQQLTAPISTASSLAGIWGSMPLNLLHGQDTSGTDNKTSDSTVTTTPSIMSQIGSGLSLAGSIGTGLAGLGVPMPGMTSNSLGGLSGLGVGNNVMMPQGISSLGSLTAQTPFSGTLLPTSTPVFS